MNAPRTNEVSEEMNNTPDFYILKLIYNKKVVAVHFDQWNEAKVFSILTAFLKRYNARKAPFLSRLERTVAVSPDNNERDDIIHKQGKNEYICGVEILDFIENQNRPRKLSLGNFSYMDDPQLYRFRYSLDFDDNRITKENSTGALFSCSFADYCNQNSLK